MLEAAMLLYLLCAHLHGLSNDHSCISGMIMMRIMMMVPVSRV